MDVQLLASEINETSETHFAPIARLFEVPRYLFFNRFRNFYGRDFHSLSLKLLIVSDFFLGRAK